MTYTTSTSPAYAFTSVAAVSSRRASAGLLRRSATIAHTNAAANAMSACPDNAIDDNTSGFNANAQAATGARRSCERQPSSTRPHRVTASRPSVTDFARNIARRMLPLDAETIPAIVIDHNGPYTDTCAGHATYGSHASLENASGATMYGFAWCTTCKRA